MIAPSDSSRTVELERGGEIVERDELLIVDDGGGEAAAAVFRKDGEGGRLTREGAGKNEGGENDGEREDRTAWHALIVQKG